MIEEKVDALWSEAFSGLSKEETDAILAIVADEANVVNVTIGRLPDNSSVWRCKKRCHDACYGGCNP